MPNKPLKNSVLAKQLKGLREKIGLSQAKFAKLFETSQENIFRWESGIGEPSTEILSRIANKFSLTIDELITGNPADKNLILEEENKKLKEIISDIGNTIARTKITSIKTDIAIASEINKIKKRNKF
jgi:transcriptional regulator with XRE-family HTH domain